ncbi:hypothetical protein G5I_05284 [Acromyrmex echinatior]|uniref:Uncharacterized protein n=1 Tax=Acromyrmex echinatior TaxID=103372 RepID=F4WI15_ACREC|nr:hypothetical protein G5I_05284 [Acromyrmex echinatior]
MLDYDADGLRTENGKEYPANKANIGSVGTECLRSEIARNDGNNSRVNLVDSRYHIYRSRDGKVRKVNHNRSFYSVAPNGCTIPPSSVYEVDA